MRQASSHSEKALRVLLIEDSQSDVFFVRRLLAKCKERRFEIEEAQSLQQALERLPGGVDAIVLDCGLPDNHGVDGIEKLRAAAPGIPIIVLTGLESEMVARLAVSLGACAYLFKSTATSESLEKALIQSVTTSQQRGSVA